MSQRSVLSLCFTQPFLPLGTRQVWRRVWSSFLPTPCKQQMGTAISSLCKACRSLKKCLNYDHVEREYKQASHPTQGPRKTAEYSLVSGRKEEPRDSPQWQSWDQSSDDSKATDCNEFYHLKAILSLWALFKIRMTGTHYKICLNVFPITVKLSLNITDRFCDFK